MQFQSFQLITPICQSKNTYFCLPEIFFLNMLTTFKHSHDFETHEQEFKTGEQNIESRADDFNNWFARFSKWCARSYRVYFKASVRVKKSYTPFFIVVRVMLHVMRTSFIKMLFARFSKSCGHVLKSCAPIWKPCVRFFKHMAHQIKSPANENIHISMALTGFRNMFFDLTLFMYVNYKQYEISNLSF